MTNRSPAHIAFCFSEDDVCAGLTRDVVALSLDAYMAAKILKCRLIDETTWWAPQESRKYAVINESIWDSGLSADMGGMIKHFSYVYWKLSSPLAYWHRIASQAIEVLDPEDLTLPIACEERFRYVRSLQEMHSWLLCATLNSVLGETQSWSKVKGLSNESVVSPTSLVTESTLSRLAHHIGKFMRAMKGRTSTLKIRQDHLKAAHAEVVIIGQPTKSSLLLRELRTTYRTQQMLVDDIVPGHTGDGFCLKEPILLDTFMDPWQGLWAYVQALAEEFDGTLPGVERFVDLPWQLLLTEHEHDPVVRAIVDQAIVAGKSVAFFPEGAQWPVNENAWINRAWHHDVKEVSRFVLGSAYLNTEMPASKSSELIVTGYLGNTHDVSDVLMKLFRFARRFRKLLFRKSILVLLDIYASAAPGLGWLGQPSEIEDMNLAETMIEHLAHKNIFVVAKPRSARVARYLNERFLGRHFIALVRFPWQLLAQLCDVVVIRDSSIGIESLALGRPVIIVRPKDVPAFCDFWSAEDIPACRVVSECSDLIESTIYLSTLSEDRVKAPATHLTFAPMNAVQWAESKLPRNVT